MSKKEDLQKKIKQDLIQKDKERIIGLYLQMKFEKDIFEKQAEELKAENAKLSGGNIFYDYVKELQIDNRQKEQQLKEKDELIERLRQDHKYEMHQLYVNLDHIAKQEERKQVCENIREWCEEHMTYEYYTPYSKIIIYKQLDNEEQPSLSKFLDQIEKGEKNEKSKNIYE